MHDRVRAVRLRARDIRRETLTMIHRAQSGHPGGSLSEADILAALYFDVLRIRPEEPGWAERDRFILSKGHACPAYYASLALKGYFPMERLGTLRMFGSGLQGHPVMGRLPGIDMTTGSLGQGLSVAAGMALAARRDGSDVRVYALLGDGECDEGQVWEAAMTASKYGLGNLCAIIDNNGLQNDDATAVIQPMDNLRERFAAFGWRAVAVNGHDIWQLLAAFDDAKRYPGTPTCIVARTTKGKGVSFMENAVDWHGKPPNDDEYARAMRELEVP